MDSAPGQLRQVGGRVVAVLVLLVVLAGVSSAAAPGTAQGFIGESAVIKPGIPPTLTPAAQSIITNPTFLTTNVGESLAAGGVAESSGAASVMQAAGLVPVLGSVLAFGVGTVIGSEICGVLGIEGCWYFGSEGADPPQTGGSWVVFNGTTVEGFAVAQGLRYNWIWDKTGGESNWQAWNGTGCESGPAAPATTSTLVARGATSTCRYSLSPLKEGPFTPTLPMRYLMSNRTMEYHATDNPSIPNTSWTAPSDWPEKMAGAIAGEEGTPAARVGQKIASQIPGSEVLNPYGTYVHIPDCDGMVYATCADLLEELSLEPAREDLNWSEVETTTPNEVRELDPAKSKQVEVGTGVKVITNPPEEGMPIVVPEPEPGETYSHYAARLNPALTPERHDLDAAFIDPSVGPNGVVSTSPKPETRLNPSTTHKVDVSTNPADTPVPAAGWSPPPLSGIDLGLISGIPSPCTVFPFGLFCWVGEAFAQFNTSGTCPNFSAPVADTGADFAVTLCGDTSETIMGYLRPALLLAFIVGCGFMFARGTRAVGGD